MSVSIPDDDLMQRQQSADLGHSTKDEGREKHDVRGSETVMKEAVRKAKEGIGRRRATLADR